MGVNDQATRRISATLAATVTAAVLGASASCWTNRDYTDDVTSAAPSVPAVVLTETPGVREADATLD